jgi:hypothetical protein
MAEGVSDMMVSPFFFCQIFIQSRLAFHFQRYAFSSGQPHENTEPN